MLVTCWWHVGKWKNWWNIIYCTLLSIKWKQVLKGKFLNADVELIATKTWTSKWKEKIFREDIWNRLEMKEAENKPERVNNSKLMKKQHHLNLKKKTDLNILKKCDRWQL